MTEQECLAKMIAPGQVRPSKPYRGGVIQILITSRCDKSCFSCTQASQIATQGREDMTVEQFEQALQSLAGYFGVYGTFGGNPALHRDFETICLLLQKYVPWEQRGIWSNNPITLEKAQLMRETFNPAVSNLNVHLDRRAYDLFKQGWPESRPVGLTQDSRHSPPFVAMKDLDVLPAHPGQDKGIYTKVPNTEENRYTLIADCDINQHWSAMIGIFRGQLRGWFCEVAGAQAILHQHEPDYPDTGVSLMFERVMGPDYPWWKLGMVDFADQVRKHCHSCGVPLRGHGELAQAYDGTQNLGIPATSLTGEYPSEQVSATHVAVYKPKRANRRVEVVTELVQLGVPLKKMTAYLQNAAVVGVAHAKQ